MDNLSTFKNRHKKHLALSMFREVMVTISIDRPAQTLATLMWPSSPSNPEWSTELAEEVQQTRAIAILSM